MKGIAPLEHSCLPPTSWLLFQRKLSKVTRTSRPAATLKTYLKGERLTPTTTVSEVGDTSYGFGPNLKGAVMFQTKQTPRLGPEVREVEL